MNNNILLILTAALTIFVIRALPLTLIQKEIKNTFIKSFLYYVPYVTLAVMTFPAILEATRSPISGLTGFIVGLLVAYFSGNLFKVAISACVAVYIAEFFLL